LAILFGKKNNKKEQMKKIKHVLLFVVSAVFAVTNLSAQQTDSTGLPGDHFSLQGALELFKKSSSPEEFEQLINEKENNVNNLDLNEDGEVDYVKVIGKKEKNMHILVLQAAVSATENQDIAVIEIEKTGQEEADLQIVGDEEIYGEAVIVEAADDNQQFAMNYTSTHGPSIDNGYEQRLFVNVWFWPGIRFMYAPAYRVWASPWHWGYRPAWYRPWKPYAWHAYQPLRYRYYHPGVRVVHTHRVVHVHHYYRPYRISSTTVRTRNATTVNNYSVNRSYTTVNRQHGATINKRSTTVSTPRGNTYQKKTTTVRGPHGKVKAQKSSVEKTRTRRNN
jgi:hypothetical protein